MVGAVKDTMLNSVKPSKVNKKTKHYVKGQ